MQPGYLPPAPPGPAGGGPASSGYANPSVGADDPMGRLATSARGWHSIQLAVLGFIGICGVLRTGGGGDEPSWVQWLAGLLALLALLLAALATYLVGQVAYPFYGGSAFAAGDGTQRAELAGRRLRAGIRVTFFAVGAIAIAALSAWWPGAPATPPATGATVAVQTNRGQRVCGALIDAPIGTVRLQTAQGQVSIRFADLAVVRPVDGC